MPNDIPTTDKGGGGYASGEQAYFVVLMYGDSWQEAVYAYFSQSINMFRVPQDILTGENTADAINGVLGRCGKVVAFLSVDSFDDILRLMAGGIASKLIVIRIEYVDAEVLLRFKEFKIPYLPQVGQPLSKYKNENEAIFSIEKHIKRLLGMGYEQPINADDLPIWIIQKPI